MLALISAVTVLFGNVHIVLGLTTKNDCGTLTIEEPAVKGGTVTFKFVPVNYAEGGMVSWLRYTSATEWKSITHASSSSTSKTDSVYYLLLSNSTETDTTLYKVVYGFDFSYKFCETAPIQLNLTVNREPHRKLMFVKTIDFDGCVGCVYGTDGDTIIIGCNTGIGPEPLNVYIHIAQIRNTGYLDKGAYTTRWRVDEGSHMKQVKCEVHINNITAPLDVLSTLYVLHRPQIPEIHMENLTEDQPINLSCTSTGSRPAGNVSMQISGLHATSYQLIQTNTRDSSGTFTSISVLTSMKREWNGRTIKCCVSHETLEKTLCSKEESINYTLPSTSVATKSLPSPNEYRPSHLLTVTCFITNAISTCQAAWNIRDISVLNVMLHTTFSQDNGRNTTNVTVRDVSNDTSGNTTDCRISCKELDVNNSDKYCLVPYGRVIYIHVSTTNNTEAATVGLQCTVKSYPVSTIRSLNTSLAGKRCEKNNISEDSGVYMCLTNKSNENDIQIHVIEQQHKDSGGYNNDVVDNDDDDKEDDDNEDNKHFRGTHTNRGDNPSPIIWPIVGASAAVVVFVIIGLVIKLIVSKTEDSSQINNAAIPSAEVDQGCPVYATVLPKSQRQTNANDAPAEPACQHGIEMFDENDESDGSTYQHDETTFEVNNESYACDISVSLRHSVLADKQEKSNGLSKELIYADLDIQPSGSSIRPRVDSSTEYVSIDFTKTVFTVHRDSSA